MKNRTGSWGRFAVLGGALLSSGCGIDAFREGATNGIREGVSELVSFFFTGFLSLLLAGG